MARFGLEVYDEDGEFLLENESLLHRLWYTKEVTAATDLSYPEPLDHEPTVFIMGVASVVGSTYYPNDPYAWEHWIDNDQWIGLKLYTTPRVSGQHRPQEHSVIVVLARR